MTMRANRAVAADSAESRQERSPERAGRVRSAGVGLALATCSCSGQARADLEIWVGIGAFVLVLAAWTSSPAGLVQPQFLPSPQAVLAAWGGLFAGTDYLADIGISVARVWVAFLASARDRHPARHPDEQLPGRRRSRPSR